jgi:hypothetical protein
LSRNLDAIEDVVVNLIKEERAKEKLKNEGPNGDVLRGDNGRQLRRALDLKADRLDIEALHKMKCDKHAIDSTFEQQELMHAQFKQMLALFVQVFNIQLGKASDSKNGLDKQKSDMVK